MAIGFNLLLVLRVVQAVFAIIILGLTAYGNFPANTQQCDVHPLTYSIIVAHWWSGYWHSYSPSEVNFLIFASVWTLLALIYLFLTPLRFPKFAHVFAILGVEAVTMLFWFAGFIALAVFLGDRVCFGSVCSSAKAAAVFAAFEWYVHTSSSAAREPLSVYTGDDHLVKQES
jgi:hypothetical protein